MNSSCGTHVDRQLTFGSNCEVERFRCPRDIRGFIEVFWILGLRIENYDMLNRNIA